MSNDSDLAAPDFSKPADYGYEVDLSTDSTAANIIKLVGRGKDVLDVGAGPGSISRVLTATFGCTVDAIEREKSAAEVCRNYVREVYEIDLALQDNFAELTGKKYDVIILSDVIEHLYDPWSVVRKLATVLRDDGFFVVSIPHAGHNSIIASLILGDFKYGDLGLLDKTHIRFFGPKNLGALFLNMGFSLVAMKFIFADSEHTELAAAWNQLPKKMKKILLGNPLGSVYQIVVKAGRTDRFGRGLDINSIAIELPPIPAYSKAPCRFRSIPRRLLELFSARRK